MPGIASVVSEKTWSGSRPDTKVSEQRIWATKPVAIRGTSCARTAVSASAPHSVVVTRNDLFFRVTVFLRQSLAIMACRDMTPTAAQALAGFGNRAGGRLQAPRRFRNL